MRREKRSSAIRAFCISLAVPDAALWRNLLMLNALLRRA
jgi:hypothetical protein